MEAVAKHDFNASAQDELSFKRGDILKIINMVDDDCWYKAELNGHEGLIPCNYIEMKEHNWYYGRITRADAEKLLKSNEQDGAFLVRVSESSPGDFSLSVKCADQVQHFKVLRDQNGKFFLWCQKFDSLNALIEHHRTESVSRHSLIVLKDMNESSNQFLVKALYDFVPSAPEREDGELEFRQGELIVVFDRTDNNWWGGMIGERRGYFPATYVKPYEKH